MVLRADCQKLHWASFKRVVKYLPVKIDVHLFLELLFDFVSEDEGVLKREWEGKREVRRSIFRASECVIETQGEVFIDVQKGGHFVKNSTPLLFWMCTRRLYAEHWPKSLIVEFLLFINVLSLD